MLMMRILAGKSNPNKKKALNTKDSKYTKVKKPSV